VKLSHFETLAPICPVCLLAGRTHARLRLLHVERGDDNTVHEGALSCTACGFEFPILDGIPLIMANVRETVHSQMAAFMQRRDISAYAASFLADCAGPGSDFERERYRCGAYAHAHWSPLPDVAAAGAGAVIHAGLQLLPPPRGTWIDIGCSLGRSAVELIRAGVSLVAAVDLNLNMLRAFAEALRTGSLTYDLRRVGVVYDRITVDIAIDDHVRNSIAVWACDAAALPFAAGIAHGALSINLIDCMAYPINQLSEMTRVLHSGGHACIASPFDWSTVATPFESWLGGHTQRGPLKGSSQAELERILGATDPAGLGVRMIGHSEAHWAIPVHERATMQYRTFIAAARKN
jgi:uncharacterized protein YbaR (Trm112 family)/SAM-dependent methyltransferase